MGKCCADIFSRRRMIEREYEEPLRDVVAGFIPLGLTRRETAETLGVSLSSLRRFCAQSDIHFPGLSERRIRGGHFVEQTEARRRDRICQSMRARAPRVAYRGLELPLSDWAERLGVSKQTLRNRIVRGGSLFV
jgi:AraC-like DNA-binding protein